MIADLKPYPAVKDSGVPWLGEVPEHWNVKPLKRVCSRSALYGANVAATSYTATGVRFLRTTDITDDGQLKSAGVFVPEESVRDYMLADGDVLISRSGTIGRSFLYASKAHGSCAYAGYLVRFVPASDVLPKYVFLFTKTQAFADFLRVMAISSTIENVNGEKYANAALPLPPLPEQSAIVRFLDRADRRIQRYIRAKQKLIKLLEEQKQVIIHRAVTCGLDPNVRLKPSGVEWLGNVPQDWVVRRLKAILRPVDRRSSSGTETLLSLRRDHGVVVYAEHFSRPPQGATTVGFKLVKAGQLVVNRLQANNGLLFCSGLRGLVSPDYSVFEARLPVDMQYLGSLLRTVTYKAHFRRESTGLGTGSAGFLRLYDDRLLETPVALPPVGEQSRLLVSLRESTTSLGRAVDRQHMELDLLREYRTRLIADVVTGKLDVRAAATNLPDESDEPEALDDTDALAEGDESSDGDLDAAPEEAEA